MGADSLLRRLADYPRPFIIMFSLRSALYHTNKADVHTSVLLNHYARAFTWRKAVTQYYPNFLPNRVHLK